MLRFAQISHLQDYKYGMGNSELHQFNYSYSLWMAKSVLILSIRTSCNADTPYPTNTSLAEPQRMQRHVSDSITTIRWLLAKSIAILKTQSPSG